MATTFDYVLVGGGLQSALIALAVHTRQPEATLAVIEKSSRLGGNHVWCFHAGDIPPGSRPWLNPLICKRWPGYRVRFPTGERRIDREYAAITSARLQRVLQDLAQTKPGSRLVLGAEATHIGADRVVLGDGSSLKGTVVIDARGPSPRANGGEGYQKFVGLEAELCRPHGIDLPMLMDATVDQQDGYRFMYTLPLTPRRLLVEDTFFSNHATLDREALRRGILAHMAANRFDVERVVREEVGILPMPWAGDCEIPRRGPLVAGYRGGFFHPATGYSFPVAARLAEVIASQTPEALFGAALQELARAHRSQVSFCHFLNSMLFRWFPPRERWHVFERFYRLPPDTIERFYALRLRPVDRGRLLLGRPPRGFSPRYRLAKGVQR